MARRDESKPNDKTMKGRDNFFFQICQKFIPKIDSGVQRNQFVFSTNLCALVACVSESDLNFGERIIITKPIPNYVYFVYILFQSFKFLSATFKLHLKCINVSYKRNLSLQNKVCKQMIQFST